MNTLKERVGPLPLWGWLAIMTVAAVGYWWWRSKNASSTTSTTDTTAQDQVPEFVIQNQFPVQVSGDGGSGGDSSTGSGGSSGGSGHECSPSKVNGYTVVSQAEAEADKKLGAKVMALTPYPKCQLIPWNGKAGPQLFISTSWLQKNGKKASTGASSHSSSASAPPATKAPARPAAQPTSPTPAQVNGTKGSSRVPAKTTATRRPTKKA